MAQIRTGTSRGHLVPLFFSPQPVAPTKTNVHLNPKEVDATVLDTTGYVMPFDGEIVAISAHLSAAATAGTLTIGPTIAGTEKTDPTLSITTQTEKSDTCGRGKAVFAKDAVIGAEITTTAAWTAETMDLQVIVWVLLYLEGI